MLIHVFVCEWFQDKRKHTRRYPGFDRVLASKEDVLLEEVLLENVLLADALLEDALLEDTL